MGMLEFSQLLITKAFWADCIDLFVKWVGNYGWAIILLTIALKLILSPIDIMQKRVNKKNAKMQAIMQPELQKVQQQFPGDRNKLNQKQMELAKKYNFNMTGTCLTLLISLIVTLTIFTSLFISLNALSSKQENIAFNGFKRRSKIFNCNLKDLKSSDFKKHLDVVICNPPYFKIDNNSFTAL